MKRLYRKIAALGSAFVMATVPFSLEACTKEKEPSPEPEQPPIVQPVETEQDKAVKLYFGLVNSMKGGKFTLSNGSKTYKFSGGRAEIDGGVYFTENGRNVCIVGGVKDYTDTSAVASRNKITAQFDGVDFDGYNNGVLSGTLSNGDEVSVKVSSNKIEMTVNGETWTVSDINNTNVNQQECTQDKTVEKPPVEKTLQEAAAEINSFLDGVKQSQKFTYTKTENSNVKKYSFLNGLMKVEKDGAVRIYEEEGENKYVYSQQNGAWNKDFTDKSIADALESFDTFVTGIKNASWESFEANQLSGTYNGKNVTAKLNGNTLEMNVDDKTVTISNSVESFAKPAQVTDVTDESEKLWENVAGQRVYNYKLLAQTLEDWIKENDYLKTYYYGDNYKLNKILFLNNESNQIRLYALQTYNDNVYKIRDFVMDATALSEEKNSTEKLKNYLTSTAEPLKTGNIMPITVEYSSFNATPEQKTEMEGLTQSVFNEIAESGWKLGQSGQPTKLEYFKNLKVLFSARTALSGSSAAGGVGESKSWHQYYLVDKNGELQWIDLPIRASIAGMSPIERVIKKQDSLWYCEEPQNKDVDKGNSQIYDNVLKTSAKTFNL